MLDLDLQQLSISISQIISACLLFVAVLGIMLTYRQTRLGFKMQKANFFKDIYSTMFSDEEVRAAVYMIEYGQFTYDETFHGSPQEKMIDRMLSFADLTCDLYAQKVLTAHEMDFFAYEFYRIYKDPAIQKYLDYLKSRFVETGQDIEPFPAFVAYCETVLRQRGQAGIRLLGNLRFDLKATIARLGRPFG